MTRTAGPCRQLCLLILCNIKSTLNWGRSDAGIVRQASVAVEDFSWAYHMFEAQTSQPNYGINLSTKLRQQPVHQITATTCPANYGINLSTKLRQQPVQQITASTCPPNYGDNHTMCVFFRRDNSGTAGTTFILTYKNSCRTF